MDKTKARDILAKALGLESDEKNGVDPEMFLLRLGVAIVSQQKAIEGLVKQYEQTKSEETKQLSDLTEKLRGRTEDLNKLEQLQTKILQAIQEKKIEKIEVERIVERAPETIKLDVKYPNQDKRDGERKSFFESIKATFSNVTDGISAIVQEIQSSRKEGGAIAVRLVDAKGKDFYNALLSVAGGGGGTTFVDSVLASSLVSKTVDFTASQTAQTIWEPTAGKKFVITDYHLSFSVAGAITVFDGTDDTTNRVVKYNGAANGGANHSYRKPRISSAVNNVLKYTTGAGAAGSLTVEGYEVS